MANKLAVAGAESKYKLPGAEPAGFWHGTIAPMTFLISLFYEDVSIYETNNDANWYNFGFLMGIGGCSGGSSRAA